MYQSITLIGNLGRAPEIRYTTSGTAVTNFNLATSRSWTGQDGKRQEKTIWFRISAWDKMAEACNQYLDKGSRVLVVGEIEEPNVWTDRDGAARATLQVTAKTVRFLTSKNKSTQEQAAPSAAPQAAPAAAKPVFGNSGNDQKSTLSEDEIPF